MHRGCVLGAVLGAACGESGIPAHLKRGLYDSEKIAQEIDAFKAAVNKSSM